MILRVKYPIPLPKKMLIELDFDAIQVSEQWDSRYGKTTEK